MAALHERVGLVTQDVQLFNASVRDNLSLFEPDIADARLLEALRAVELEDWYESLPEGLDTVLPAGGGGMSAGQAQLLAFARMMLNDPGLVILDEASSRLDPITEQRLDHALDRLLAKRTAIIIAHRLATVQRADWIMILDGGRCVEFGPRTRADERPAVAVCPPAACGYRGGARMNHSTPRLLLALGRYRSGTYILMTITVILVPYLFDLVPGLIARSVFDQLSGQAAAGLNVWSLLAVLVSLAVAANLSVLFGFWLEGVIIVHVETLLRRNMLAHIFGQPGARALPTSPGEAISRFRDDPRAILQFLTYAPDIPTQVLVLLISLVILARINVLFTLAVFVPLLLTIVAVHLATKRIRRYRQANQEAIGAVTGMLGDIFGAVQAIKVAGAERHVVRYFSAINERRRHVALRDLLLLQTLSSFASNAANIAVGLLLLLAAQRMQSGGTPLTVGDLALFVTYLGSLAGLIGFFGEILTRYRQTEVSVQRLLALLPGEPPETLVAHADRAARRAAAIALCDQDRRRSA